MTMGLTLQPHVIVICEDINSVDTVDGSIPYAIIQSNLYYELLIIVAAVDVCIKACFVMDLSYAVGAQSSWVYIRKDSMIFTPDTMMLGQKYYSFLLILTSDMMMIVLL